MTYTTVNEATEPLFTKQQTFSKSVEPAIEKSRLKTGPKIDTFMRFAADWKQIVMSFAVEM